MTSSSGAFTGSLRSRIWSSSVKMAVLAPMPSASDRMATIENSGLRRRPRSARRKSPRTVLMVFGLTGGRGEWLLSGSRVLGFSGSRVLGFSGSLVLRFSGSTGSRVLRVLLVLGFSTCARCVLLIESPRSRRFKVSPPSVDCSERAPHQRHAVHRLLRREVLALLPIAHVVFRFIERRLCIRKELKDLGRIESRVPFRNVPRPTAGGIANLSAELEILPDVRVAREPEHLSSDFHGKLVTIQIFKPLH